MRKRWVLIFAAISVVLTADTASEKTLLDSAELYNPPFVMPAPALLALSGDRQGAILHTDTHQPVSSTNPGITDYRCEFPSHKESDAA